jgi:hypothetical protein
MADSSENQFIADIARALVADLAPLEMPVFRANADAYFKNPGKAIQHSGEKDRPLGFGVTEAAGFLTPVALAVTGQVFTFLISEVKKSFQKESASLIQEKVKELFKKGSPPGKKPSITLTPAQLKEVHKVALAKAHALHLSDMRAHQLADALVSDLAI